MSDVPSDAFREILIRIPAESLPRLRRVCKAWRQIIDDPAFLRLHIHRQLDGGERLIMCKRTGGCGKLYSLPLSSLNHSGEKKKSVEAISIKNLSCKGVSPILNMPVPSCHGLILLRHSYDAKFKWTVWNPFVKDFRELPLCDFLIKGRCSSDGGIGYDASTDDYKVVRLQQHRSNNVLDTFVYSLKSNAWRKIEDYPPCVERTSSSYGVFSNGALHWFVRIKQEGVDEVGKILSFDLATEKYRQIPVPQPTFASKCPVSTHVEAVSECLFITYFEYGRFDIWMLNDEQAWDMIVSLKGLRQFGIRLGYPSLISYSKTKQQVSVWNWGELLWFDVETKCGRKVSVLGLEESFSCQAFPLSLIRLNGGSSQTHATNASKGTFKRKRLTPNDRLPLKLKSTDNFLIPSDAEDDSDMYDDDDWMSDQDGEDHYFWPTRYSPVSIYDDL